jgi:four helix bundle protein
LRIILDILGFMASDFKVEDLSSYKISVELSSAVYKVVKPWAYLDKQTVGIQFIKAVDSVAANIAEGFGRFHKKDKIKFFYNARGSALEAKHWLETANQRSLLKDADYRQMIELMAKLPKEINLLIKLTASNLRR